MNEKALRGSWAALILASALSLLPSALSSAEELNIRYRTLQTKYLRLVFYDDRHEYVVRHLGRCFENSIAFHRNLFQYEPSGPVTIHFQDFDDFGYAGTTTIPFNYFTLGIEPFEYVYDTCPTNERMNWVTNHELMHIVASDQATRGDRLFRRLFFGKVPPTDEDPVSIIYS